MSFYTVSVFLYQTTNPIDSQNKDTSSLLFLRYHSDLWKLWHQFTMIHAVKPWAPHSLRLLEKPTLVSRRSVAVTSLSPVRRLTYRFIHLAEDWHYCSMVPPYLCLFLRRRRMQTETDSYSSSEGNNGFLSWFHVEAGLKWCSLSRSCVCGLGWMCWLYSVSCGSSGITI